MNEKKRSVPLLPLRGLCVLPHTAFHFDVGRPRSMAALQAAEENDNLVMLAMQHDAITDEPEPDDIKATGTIVRVKQSVKMPGETVRVLVESVCRARVDAYEYSDPYFRVACTVLDDEGETTLESEARMRMLSKAFGEYAKGNDRIAPGTLLLSENIEAPGHLADVVAEHVLPKAVDKQEVLETFDVVERLDLLQKKLAHELDILQLENTIQGRVKSSIDKNQRSYYLREQLKAIHMELGEGEEDEAATYRKRIEALRVTKEVKEKALKEVERLTRVGQGSPELGVIRGYLDWILEVPWDAKTKDNRDLEKARAILDADHYGLHKVKERVIEYLAVKQLTQSMKGPILCFVGPPGVGKTSIVQSIARALGRQYVRMALGGVRDEAEIRGHRRTYIGAMPGSVITHMKQAGSVNPVFLFDEVDKMSHDFRGDPASAMLEVLDGEQNGAFRDHYLEVPYDLSHVMFVATANSIEGIPQPLLDRMELIFLQGYTEEEKMQIARRHLLPKQMKENGLPEGALLLTDDTIVSLIRGYTREAGVRALERQIAAICRKCARRLLVAKKKSGKGAKPPRMRVTARSLAALLGTTPYRREDKQWDAAVGVATGMAWTSVGGQTLEIEATALPGSGHLELTGRLGDVMKESAQAGLSFVRGRAQEMGLEKDFYKQLDVHIHVPEGATPKDGPSAGITMAAAMVSAISGKPIRTDIAMTGEITLRGRVLPIGGVKEKVLAAHRNGIRHVLLPDMNRKDVDELPAAVRRDMEIRFVSRFEEVWQAVSVQQERSEA